MPRIDLAIATVARPGLYIHELLSSLRRDLPIRLIVGAPDCGYLKGYRGQPCIEIVEAAQEEWRRFEACPVRHRATWNYWRCLTLGTRSPSRDGLLVLEDDIRFAGGWEPRLHEAIRQINENYEQYILALYKPREPLPGTVDAGVCFRAYPVRQFYGTQGMYYPETVRGGFADYLKANGVEAYRQPYDLVLKEYLNRTSTPLFLTFPCLVQHIGTISTGLSARFHRARQFQGDLRPSCAGGSRTADQWLCHSGETQLISQRPRILACCRVSVREADIFRLWIQHYAPHVDQLAVVILAEGDDRTEELENTCVKSQVRYQVCKGELFHPGTSMSALERVVRQIKADWVVHMDSDEFLAGIGDIRNIVARMADEGADYAAAWMVDRLAFGGRLGAVEGLADVADLEAAFPVRARVTAGLAKACINKVCVCRWPFVGAIHKPGDHLRRAFHNRLTLEHFKWRIGLEERLEKRMRDDAASNLPWGAESLRILEELRIHGRIRAECWLAPRSRRIHGWMDYEDIYLEAVKNAPEDGHFVEVGVWQGRSLCFLAEAALAVGKHLRIDGVDPFRNYCGDKSCPRELRSLVRSHSWLDQVTHNLREQGMLDYVNLLQASSLHAAQLYRPESLDFVWVDGDHRYGAVLADLQAWWPRIKRGGVLAGHDYDRADVRRAIADAQLQCAQLVARRKVFLLTKLKKPLERQHGDSPVMVGLAKRSEGLPVTDTVPHITASIPYYKCKPYVRRAVETLLGQSYRNITIVVINDGDPEPPWDLLADLKDQRLLCHQLPANYGPYFAHAVVLGACDTDLFLISDADDWSGPERVERLVSRIIEEDAIAVFSATKNWNEVGKCTGIRRHRLWAREPSPPACFCSRVPHQGLFLSSILKQIGGYYGGFRIGYDTFLMNILPMLGRIAYVKRPVYNRLLRPGSLSHAPETNMQSAARSIARAEMLNLYGQVYAAYRDPQISPESLALSIRQIVQDRIPPDIQQALAIEQQALAQKLKTTSSRR